MTIRTFAIPVLSAAMLFAVVSATAQGYPQQQPPQQQQNYPQQQQGYPPQQQGYPPQGGQYGAPPQGPGGWDQAPHEYTSDFQRQGFRDGISAARSDFQQHRQPNPLYRPEYRHPSVPRPVRNDYRAGFQRGYDVATRHMMEHREERHEGYGEGGYPPPPPPPR